MADAKPPVTHFYTYDPTDPPRYHCRVIDDSYFDWLLSSLAGTGLTFLYRCNLAGRAYYPSQHLDAFDEDCIDASHESASRWARVTAMMRAGDPLAAAVRAARKHDVPIWIWWNWNEFQNVRKGCLSLIDSYWYDRPRSYWCNRDGSRFYHGVPDYGHVPVRERLLAMLDESLDYDVDGVYLSTRSHSWFACWQSPGWEEHLEPFGFNDSIVNDYRAKHGVDIRYEDYDQDAWLRIKGDHFSTLLSMAGQRVHQRNGKFIVGLSPDRYNLMGMGDKWPGKQHLQLYKDWERWAEDGSIDGLCAEQNCPHQRTIESSPLQLFRETLPNDFPLYLWFDTAWFNNRGAGPFSLANWDRLSVDQVLSQFDQAQQLGAAGAFFHTLYHYTSCDTDGESIGGYGVLPRTEYLDAIRERFSALPLQKS